MASNADLNINVNSICINVKRGTEKNGNEWYLQMLITREKNVTTEMAINGKKIDNKRKKYCCKGVTINATDIDGKSKKYYNKKDVAITNCTK